MYPSSVIYSFWALYSFCLACWFWLRCHIFKMSWTVAIRCNIFSSASLFISMSLSELVLSMTGSSPGSNPWLASANCLTTTVSRRVSLVVFDYLHLVISRRREKLASTLTPWDMIENISRATWEESTYCYCISSCCCHQLVISSNQNVLPITIGSEW